MFYKLLTVYYYLRAKYVLRFSSRKRLERFQRQALARILRKIKQRVPFYAKLSVTISDVSAWPLMDKHQLMSHFDTLNRAHIPLEHALQVAQQAEQSRDFTPKIGKYSVGLSSGTSGVRGVFLVSPKEQAQWSGTILAKMLPKSIFRKQKIAFFLRADNNLYESVKSNRIQFRFFDLKNPFERHLTTLQEFQPDVLVAPPTVLQLLAQAQQHKKIQIMPLKIISVADVLYRDVQEQISVAFGGLPVHQVYQATEGLIACTCRYGNLHLNEELMLIEKKYIDEKSGRFIPVLTDFNRTTQPIIHYELNDILTESKILCPCGNPATVITRIEGRCDDVLYDPKNPARPVFPDFIVRCVLRHLPQVGNFQFRQLSLDTAELALPQGVACPPQLIFDLQQIIPLHIHTVLWQGNTDLTRKNKRVIREFNR